MNSSFSFKNPGRTACRLFPQPRNECPLCSQASSLETFGSNRLGAAPHGGSQCIEVIATHMPSWRGVNLHFCRSWYCWDWSAILEPKLNLNGVQGTMHSAAPLLIVNGPYAKKIGLHGGTGCFGPGFRANATIGRAIQTHSNEPGRRCADFRFDEHIRLTRQIYVLYRRE